MVHGDFEWGFIADLNRIIILMLAHAHCMVFYFQHAHGWHRIAASQIICITEILNSERGLVSTDVNNG